MEVKYMEEENYKDLESCLSDEEKKQIEGRNMFEKIWIKMKMKKQTKQMEVFDSMIENIENNDYQFINDSRTLCPVILAELNSKKDYEEDSNGNKLYYVCRVLLVKEEGLDY